MQTTTPLRWPEVPGIPDCPPLALHPIRQRFESARTIEDLPGAVDRAVATLLAGRASLRRVGIACGSRGIARLGEIVGRAAAAVQAAGVECVLIPAMGSHGGATPGGQVEVLEHLGVPVGRLPVDASLDVEVVGHLANGTPVYLARSALACDGVIAINRVKPHTDFHGPFESGLAKMVGLGLGKLAGADTLHALGVEGLRRWMPEAARLVVASGAVLGGIAVLEHARHDVAEIHAIAPDGIAGPAEAALLARARALQAGLPFDEADVLVVGQIGKDISGTGMDTNVIGRLAIPSEPEPARPRLAAIVALRLTEGSGGNGHGMGVADYTTQALVEAVDFELTYVNAITSGVCGVQRARVPVVLPDDRRAIAAAIARCGQPDLSRLRLAVIRDTLQLEQLWVTEALLGSSRDVGPAGPPIGLAFDAAGRLAAPNLGGPRPG